MRFLMRLGVLLGIAATSLVVALASLGALAWVVAYPSYWFPEAFAERGERGPAGASGTAGTAWPTRTSHWGFKFAFAARCRSVYGCHTGSYAPKRDR
jgi:hypothetical protein